MPPSSTEPATKHALILTLWNYWLSVVDRFLLIVFYPFFTNHLSLIWGRSGEDGTSQHLASLLYYGDYIRTFFNNLIHGNFQFPMWNNSIGFGSDIITTLNYYAIGDPLNIVYVFVADQVPL